MTGLIREQTINDMQSLANSADTAARCFAVQDCEPVCLAGAPLRKPIHRACSPWKVQAVEHWPNLAAMPWIAANCHVPAPPPHRLEISGEVFSLCTSLSAMIEHSTDADQPRGEYQFTLHGGLEGPARDLLFRMPRGSCLISPFSTGQ